jgi:hypothetical protein
VGYIQDLSSSLSFVSNSAQSKIIHLLHHMFQIDKGLRDVSPPIYLRALFTMSACPRACINNAVDKRNCSEFLKYLESKQKLTRMVRLAMT